MFIAALSTIAKLWREFICPPTDERIEIWYVYAYTHTHTHTHTQEYYSAIKKNEILPFAKTWMELKCIMLNEITTQQDTLIPMFTAALFTMARHRNHLSVH